MAATIVVLILGLAATMLEAARARTNEQRAVSAEEGLKLEVRESYLRLAELSSQRGKWRQALDYYQKALDEGHPDRAGIRIKRIEALISVAELRGAREEFKKLRSTEIPEELAAKVCCSSFRWTTPAVWRPSPRTWKS